MKTLFKSYGETIEKDKQRLIKILHRQHGIHHSLLICKLFINAETVSVTCAFHLLLKHGKVQLICGWRWTGSGRDKIKTLCLLICFDGLFATRFFLSLQRFKVDLPFLNSIHRDKTSSEVMLRALSNKKMFSTTIYPGGGGFYFTET